MNRSRGATLLFVMLLVALPPAGAAARSGGTFQVAAGTWVDASGALLSPAWEIAGPTSNFGATIAGPGGFSHRIGGPAQRFPGMPETLAINWCSECNVTYPGVWSATGDDGSQTSFSIDRSSRLTPIQIDGQSFVGGTQTVSASWTAGSDAASFIAYVQPASSTSAQTWTVGKILPGSARSVSFTGLSLPAKTTYSLDVFAFSADVTSDTLPPVFNIASDQVGFTPGDPLNAWRWCSCAGPLPPPACCIASIPEDKPITPAAKVLPVTQKQWSAVLNDWRTHRRFSSSHTCAAVVVARMHAPPRYEEGTPLVHALDLYELARCQSPGDATGLRVGMSNRQVADIAGVPVPWLSRPRSWLYRHPGDGITVLFSAAGYVERIAPVITLGVVVATPPP